MVAIKMTTPNGKHEFEAALELLEAHWVQESLAYGDKEKADSFKAAVGDLRAALATLEALAEENAALKCREKAIPERDK